LWSLLVVWLWSLLAAWLWSLRAAKIATAKCLKSCAGAAIASSVGLPICRWWSPCCRGLLFSLLSSSGLEALEPPQGVTPSLRQLSMMAATLVEVFLW